MAFTLSVATTKPTLNIYDMKILSLVLKIERVIINSIPVNTFIITDLHLSSFTWP